MSARRRCFRILRQTALALSLLFIAGLTACISHRDAENMNRELAQVFATPFNTLATKLSQGDDLIYATAAHQRKNARWPNDYAELTNFVAKSDGYLILKPYEDVTFRQETNGGVQVVFLPVGKITNKVTVTLEPLAGNEAAR